MAINAYTGLMGSGKSYEVVSSVIIPAVLAGRRVITNIDGINPQAILQYCIERRKADAAVLGQVVRVSNQDVMRDGFFPDEDRPEVSSMVQPGDMVAIDEAWEFWSTGNRIKPEHQRFFRMHRHFVHPLTGVACDVVLMIQSISDLHRQLRAVVELTFRTKKLKELGATRCYRVEMYETNKLTKALLLDTFNKTYDKEIFPLYRSYSGDGGKEASIDKRQNILANRRIWFVCGIVTFVWIVCARLIWRFFNPVPDVPSPVATRSDAAGNVSAPMASERPSVPPISQEWRVVGAYSDQRHRWVVVADPAGQMRIEAGSLFSGAGISLIGRVDGKRVTTWSGKLPVKSKAGE